MSGIVTTEAVAEANLQGIALRIESWQKAQRPILSDAAMIKRFPALGSSKTYSWIRRGQFDGFNVANQSENYQAVLSQIEEIGAGDEREEVYDDFANAVAVSSSVIRLMQQTGEDRLLILEGPTGSGKTTVKKLMVAKFPGKIVAVDANVAWSSVTSALMEICQALGDKRDELRQNKGNLKHRATELLNRSNVILWIDESHHMTGDVLNLLKTFMNESDSAFVIAGIDTLWAKLTARYFEEAKQLLQNRLFQRIRLAAPTKRESQEFLSRRCPALNGAAGEAAAKVAGFARDYGRYAFLRNLAKRINREGGEQDAHGITQLAEGLVKEVQR